MHINVCDNYMNVKLQGIWHLKCFKEANVVFDIKALYLPFLCLSFEEFSNGVTLLLGVVMDLILGDFSFSD